MVEKKSSSSLLAEESLFDKFQISTQTSKSELMKLFQMRPNLRKELSSYIKTIQDEKKLYCEELSSTYIDGCFYTFGDYLSESDIADGRKQLAACLSFIKEFEDNLSEDSGYWYCFADLLSRIEQIDYSKGFYYSKADISGAIAKEFIDAIWEVIEGKLTSIAAGLDVENINKLYDAFDSGLLMKRSKRCISVLNESCAAFFDTVSSRKEDKNIIEKTVEFIKTLDTRILSSDEVYPSLKQCCVSLLGSLREMDSVIFPVLPDLTLCLKEKDRESAKNVLSNYCMEFVLFDNIDKNTYKRIHSVEADIARCSAFLKKHCPSCDETLFEDVTLALCTLSESDYIRYRKLIQGIKTKNNLSGNLYELCSLVAQSTALSDYKILYFNLLTKTIGFEYEENEISRKFENWNKVIENMANERKWANYSYFVNWYRGDILTVDDIESFTCNYYALTILNPDLADIFPAIRNSVFGIITLMDYVPIYTYRYDSSKKLNPRGEFLRDFLLMLPGDWSIPGATSSDTVDRMLKDQLYVSHGSNHRDSESLPYIKKCDRARSAKKSGNKIKSVKCDISQRKASKATSQLDKARSISSIKTKAQAHKQGKDVFRTAATQKEFEKASRLFEKAGDYRDAQVLKKESDKQAEICRKNASYDNATVIQNNGGIENLRQAANLFASLNGWKDSKKRMFECLVRAEELEREQTYNDAVLAMEAAKTEKDYLTVANAFKGLGTYRDAQTIRKQCEANAEVCRKNEIFSNAKKIAKRNTLADLKKAIALFESISGWADAEAEKDAAQDALNAIMQGIYDEAKAKAATANNQSDYLAAASVLEPILEFKNAKKLKQKYEDKAETCRKDAIYQQAMDLMGNLAVSGCVRDVPKLNEAEKLFNSISGWKDSRQKAEECKNGADRIVKEDFYNTAIAAKQAACDEKSYKAAAKLFEKAKNYKDAKQQKSECDALAETCRKDAVIAYATDCLSKIQAKEIKGSDARALLADISQRLASISGWKNADELASECKKFKLRTSIGLKLGVAAALIALIIAIALLVAAPGKSAYAITMPIEQVTSTSIELSDDSYDQAHKGFDEMHEVDNCST